MLRKLIENQNWAKATPIFGIISAALLFWLFKPSQAGFWALVNIPLYFFHQTEEHLYPGGFKNYMNLKVNKLPEGQEALTDEKVFWINILLAWVAFLIFGALSVLNIGFGLLIVIISIINCLTHIVQGFKQKEWNPGLVVASLQVIVSVYAAYFITTNGLTDRLIWWVGAIFCSAVAHAIVYKTVMNKK